MADKLAIHVRLEGFDELRARMGLFPDRMRNNILRGGARAAAGILARRLKSRLAGDGLSTAAGSVRSSVKLIGARGDTVRGVVQYGGRYERSTGRGAKRQKVTRDAWYAHILEWGARPHIIKPRLGKKALQIGGRWVAKVKHPGIRARLYATTTATQDMPAANRAFEDYVERRVERYWSTGR